MKKLFFITGESSGDMHGASLLNELYKMIPPRDLTVKAVGGSALENTGADIFFNCKYLANVGLTEVLKNLSLYYNLERELLFELKVFNPDVLILVDFPGFNLRIAKKARKYLPNTKIVYYFPPQVWAWASWRTKTLQDCCDLVLCGFPFEEEFHRKRGVNAFYIGNPLVNEIENFDKTKIREELGLTKYDKIISIFPGSRKSEIHYMLPVFLKGIEILSKSSPDYKFFISQAKNIENIENEKCFQELSKSLKEKIKILPVKTNENRRLLCMSDLLWLTSGTVTLEAALYETPMILGYRGNELNYFLYKLLKKTDLIGLPNIILNEKLVPELIQNDATPENFVHHTKEILRVPGKLEAIKRNLQKVKEKLGTKNASHEAALKIRELIPEYKVFMNK